MRRLIMLFMMLTALLSGCTTINQSAREAIPFGEDWVMLPFLNNTETPYAAERAEAVATTLLYARGIKRLLPVPAEAREDDQLLPDRGAKRYQDGLEWARKKGFRYAVAGTVTEWRYKVGLDGEPVAGITLQVIDLKDNSVMWSGSGSRSGWSRDAVSAVAQQVLERLIATIPSR